MATLDLFASGGQILV